MKYLTEQDQIRAILYKLKNEPYELSHWVSPKTNGWYKVKDKNTMKVVKRFKTQQAADIWVIKTELDKINITGENSEHR